jgi:hypothetical protein
MNNVPPLPHWRIVVPREPSALHFGPDFHGRFSFLRVNCHVAALALWLQQFPVTFDFGPGFQAAIRSKLR